MKIDIWSDIVCPFCYIGKRRLEHAISQFEHRDKVEIIWHSFRLDPGAEPKVGKDVYDYLAERKGQSRDWSLEAHKQVTQMAADAGLTYNFDIAVVANTLDAHRLIHMAQKKGKGNEAEERLFKGYFTEGKNIGDHSTLIQLGKELGLEETSVKEMLESGAYANDVRNDIIQAQRIGIRGVPFFIINEKYGVSGAQYSENFLKILQQAWEERKNLSPTGPADSCGPEGNC